MNKTIVDKERLVKFGTQKLLYYEESKPEDMSQIRRITSTEVSTRERLLAAKISQKRCFSTLAVESERMIRFKT